jgi:catechol 2,3-dioxygenase-like lactoylglutathione lyase family enzyme
LSGDGIAALAADAMMAAMPLRPQPLIAVSDVEVSSRFYQRLLGCESGHGGRDYERLMFDGELVLQLHDAHTADHHGIIGDPALPYGNGVLLWFAVDAFEAAVDRVRELRAEIVHEPHVNPNARQWECWLRDPDGYIIVLAGPPRDIEVAGANV